MLDVFQIKNGKFQKKYHEVKVRDSFQQIEDLFKLASEEKGITLKLVVGEEVPEILNLDD